MKIPPQTVLLTSWLCYWLKEESFLSNCQNQFFMKQMFVFKKYRREIWVFWSEHSRKWEIYFVFCVAEHLRHMACSIIEINTCSQDLQEIIIYKTIKNNFTAINKGYFMWGYYHFLCAEQFISGVEISDRSNKLIWNLTR